MGAPANSSLRDLAWFLGFIALLMSVVLSVPTVSAAEHPLRVSVLALGFLCESTGLIMAIVGFHRTWRENVPPDRPMYPRLSRLARVLLRRSKPPIVGQDNLTLPAAMGSASEVVHWAGTAPLTVEARVERLETELYEAQRAMSDLRAELAHESRARIQSLSDAPAEAAADAERPRSLPVQLAVDGIPLAVAGLGLTLFGFALQALAQVAST